ncbi:MAG: N-6 DNA methylase [Planctomycetota bacterium]|nr:N-6 DNA methylase [Planctomycetota bacterium]
MKATKAQKSKGQFFTPAKVADFTWELLHALGALEERPLTKIIDPAAGEGVFIESGSRYLPDAEFVAVDLDPAMSVHWDDLPNAKVHGVLGNGLSSIVGVAKLAVSEGPQGTRESPILLDEGHFDIVIGNPPFGGDGVKEMIRGIESDPAAGAELLRSLLNLKNWQRRPVNLHSILDELDRTVPGQNIGRALAQLKRCNIEMLFWERFVRLARTGGWVAIILPDGLLANERQRHLRDWIAEQADLRAIVTFPRATFAGVSTDAFTSLVVMQKKRLTGHRELDSAVMLSNPHYRDSVPGLDKYLESVLNSARRSEDSEFTIRVRSNQIFTFRWHTGFFNPNLSIPSKTNTRYPLRALGDFITHITYGPIITGRKTADEPSGAVRVIGQGELGKTGLILDKTAAIAEDSAFNPPKSRPQPGDLLIARSGMGALAKNRMAVFLGGFKANVGCFVDVIRLEGLNPFYVWLFLKTDMGFDQIRRFYNGVATLNISFSELRSIQIPLAPKEIQEEVAERYRERVLPLHESERFEEANRMFDELRDWVSRNIRS